MKKSADDFRSKGQNSMSDRISAKAEAAADLHAWLASLTHDEIAVKELQPPNVAKAGEMDFSDWLKTVRFRSDKGIQLSIEGDRIALTGIKGFHYTIDEKGRTVTWANSGGFASITVSPDRKSGVWTMPNGVKNQLAVIQRKPATEGPEKPKRALSKDADGWEDQLAALTPAEVEKTGHGWSLKDGELYSPDAKHATLPLRAELAGTSYQVRVKLRQLSAKNIFHIVLPVADRMCGFNLDAPVDGRIYTGLGVVNGKGCPDLPGVVKGKQVKDSEPHNLELTVRLDGENATITATLDARPLFAWAGLTASLSQYKPWVTTKPGSLALGTMASGWAVSEVKLKRF